MCLLSAAEWKHTHDGFCVVSLELFCVHVLGQGILSFAYVKFKLYCGTSQSPLVLAVVYVPSPLSGWVCASWDTAGQLSRLLSVCFYIKWIDLMGVEGLAWIALYINRKKVTCMRGSCSLVDDNWVKATEVSSNVEDRVCTLITYLFTCRADATDLGRWASFPVWTSHSLKSCKQNCALIYFWHSTCRSLLGSLSFRPTLFAHFQGSRPSTFTFQGAAMRHFCYLSLWGPLEDLLKIFY